MNNVERSFCFGFVGYDSREEKKTQDVAIVEKFPDETERNFPYWLHLQSWRILEAQSGIDLVHRKEKLDLVASSILPNQDPERRSPVFHGSIL